MKNEAIILITILLISTTFCCSDNTSSKRDSETYGSTYVNFQIPEGWELHPMPGEGTVIWMSHDPRIRIIELENKQKYDKSYNAALNIDNSSYYVAKDNKTVEGIKVNILKTINNMNGDIEDEYFFQKNGKYYHIISWAFTGWSDTNQTKSREEIEKATDIIIKTIK
ncbi:hypothetical protein [Methanobacterium oryzae]|uniref:hypothetical protein n=1 Tax=Methanobacterium oryzae TaxID=69540 RepID=UPI003D20EE49